MIHNKFWQGFFALGPIVGFIIAFIGYFIFIFSVMSQMHTWEHPTDGPPLAFLGGIGFFLIMILLVMLISLGSLVFYIVHAAQNPALKQNNMLIVWILLFIFASGLGQLIYWILEILNKRNKTPQTS